MKNKSGRKEKPVDVALLEKLTRLHLSDKVIADCCNVSTWTLERRFAQQMEVWRSQSKSKIAEVLFDEGVNNREPWALKALYQKHLDYADKVESKAENKLSGEVSLTHQESAVLKETAEQAKEFLSKVKK